MKNLMSARFTPAIAVVALCLFNVTCPSAQERLVKTVTAANSGKAVAGSPGDAGKNYSSDAANPAAREHATGSENNAAYALRYGSVYSTKPFADHANFSIAYAAADLGNPESVFGHVFLVAHDDAAPQPQSPVVEFYGMTEGSNAALLRTLTDFIPGRFKVNSFAEKIRAYDLEGRDVFIRKLRSEVDLQSFSVRLEQTSGRTFPYDFLNVNCAYYIEWLLTADAETFERSWRIRQPMDVFLKFGDARTERVVTSTERQIKQSGNALRAENEASQHYYRQRLVLRKFAAGSDVDGALRDVMSVAMPALDVPEPASTWPRESLELSVATRQKRITFSGFDTTSRQRSDPVSSHSSLHVGRVHGICAAGGACRSGVDLFDVSTHSSEGARLAKVASVSTYLEHGVEVAGRIGLGLGYSAGSLSFSAVPVAGFDTGSNARLGWENQLAYSSREIGFDIRVHMRSSVVFDPVLREKTTVRLQQTNGAWGLSYSRISGYALTYRWDFK